MNRKLMFLCLALITLSASAQNSRNSIQWPVYVTPSNSPGTVPMYSVPRSGIPVLSPSNLKDTGNGLTYKGVPLNPSGGTVSVQGSVIAGHCADFVSSTIIQDAGVTCGGGGGGTSVTLSTTGTSGAATYNTGTGALNIPVYQGAVTLTTTGTSGLATFASNTLNVPHYQGAIGLTTTGTTGAATFDGTTLNIPNYATGGGSSAFSAITGSTNTTATMVVGSGASINPTGSGVITATALTGQPSISITNLLGSGSVTFTGIQASSVTSCLQIDTTGHLSNTGLACGSGGGGFANPMTTLGDIIQGASGGTAARLAGNTTTAAQVLTSTGSGGVATAPTWTTAPALSAANMTSFPTFNQNTTGTSTGISGSQTANFVYAAPNGSAGTAVFRALVSADLPATIAANTSGTSTGISGSQTANTFLAAPNGSSGTATFRTVAAADLPLGTAAAFGAVKVDNSTIGATAGVISDLKPMTYPAGTGVAIVTSGTSWGTTISVGNTGTSIPQLSGGLLAASIIPTFGSAVNGGVPLSGGGTTNFLRADGTWASPSGSGTVNTCATAGLIGIYATTGTAISCDTNFDDGHTALNTLTYSGSGGLSTTTVKASAGLISAGTGQSVDVYGVANAAISTTLFPTNYVGWSGPISGTPTFLLQLPAVAPSGNTIYAWGTPSTVNGVSQATPAAFAAPTGVIVGTTDTQTLTGKSIAASEINSGAISISQGGTGTGSILTGLVRGNSSAMTAAELSGDATTSGSNAVTVVKVNGVAVPASPATHTYAAISASNTATYVSTSHALGWSFGDVATGSALTTSEVGYITVPYACTLTGWHIMVDAGTATLKVARINGGTALPTVGSNSINTSGIAISTGTKLDSTTLTDFTSTAIAQNDTLGFFVTAVATAKQITFQLDCAQ